MSKFKIDFVITSTSWYEYEVQADDKKGAAKAAEDMHYRLDETRRLKDKHSETEEWKTYVREVTACSKCSGTGQVIHIHEEVSDEYEKTG